MRRAFEESSSATDEQGIARKDSVGGRIVDVGDKVANVVLGMAGCAEAFDFDAVEQVVELISIAYHVGKCRDFVRTTIDWFTRIGGGESLVATGMIVVVVRGEQTYDLILVNAEFLRCLFHCRDVIRIYKDRTTIGGRLQDVRVVVIAHRHRMDLHDLRNALHHSCDCESSSKHTARPTDCGFGCKSGVALTCTSGKQTSYAQRASANHQSGAQLARDGGKTISSTMHATQPNAQYKCKRACSAMCVSVPE